MFQLGVWRKYCNDSWPGRKNGVGMSKGLVDVQGGLTCTIRFTLF